MLAEEAVGPYFFISLVLCMGTARMYYYLGIKLTTYDTRIHLVEYHMLYHSHAHRSHDVKVVKSSMIFNLIIYFTYDT